MAIATPTARTTTAVTAAEARAESVQNELALSLEEAASYMLFRHTPLDRTQRSIRLVSVHPVLSSTGRIRCSIKQVSDDQYRYRCLSYTWGPSRDYHVINLNGRGLAVRSHLWRFLNAARLVYANQEFWIDALCIDQANIGEVNHQIQLMDQIFSNAMDVIIWLGDGNSGGYLPALNFLTERRDKTTRCLSKSDLGGSGSSSNFWPEQTSVIQSLLALCEDEYWGRTWIIQEVLLAKRIFLMSGTAVTAWSHLADFLFWGIESSSAIADSPVDLVDEDLHGPARARFWDSRARLFCLERMMSSGEMHQFSLRDLLVRFGRSNCSDVRDRILGLLALADYGSAKKNGEFRVDYSLSPSQLFAYLMSFYETASVRNGRTLLYILELDLESAASVPIKLEFLMKDEHVSTSLFVQSYEDEGRERVCKYCGIDVSIMTSEFADGTICCFFQDEVEEHLVFDRQGCFQAFALRTGSDAVSETAIQKFDKKASFLTNMRLRREVRQRIVLGENGRTESEDEISYRLDVDERALAFLLYKGRVE